MIKPINFRRGYCDLRRTCTKCGKHKHPRGSRQGNQYNRKAFVCKDCK